MKGHRIGPEFFCKARGPVQSTLDDDISFYMKQANDLAIHAPHFIDFGCGGEREE